jgi:hypothetical protein
METSKEEERRKKKREEMEENARNFLEEGDNSGFYESLCRYVEERYKIDKPIKRPPQSRNLSKNTG